MAIKPHLNKESVMSFKSIKSSIIDRTVSCIESVQCTLTKWEEKLSETGENVAVKVDKFVHLNDEELFNLLLVCVALTAEVGMFSLVTWLGGTIGLIIGCIVFVPAMVYNTGIGVGLIYRMFNKYLLCA